MNAITGIVYERYDDDDDYIIIVRERTRTGYDVTHNERVRTLRMIVTHIANNPRVSFVMRDA